MPSETPPPKISSPGTQSASDKMHSKSPASTPSPQENSQTPTINPQTHQSQMATTSGSGSGSGSQQFCLRWNNYQTNLTSVFDQLLQNESFVDVTLACDGQSIKAHKMVLSACSPYFQALFFDNPCQHPIIIMRDIKWPELKAAVEFMYKGEINVSQDQIGPLLRVAEMLKIRGLADVNGEQDATPAGAAATQSGSGSGSEVASKKARVSREWELSNLDTNSATSGNNRNRKRRWPSGDTAGADSPLGGVGAGAGTPTPDNNDVASPVAGSAAATGTSQIPHPAATPNTMPSFPIPTPLESMALSSLGMSHADDMEIKPGIAEMIREEERAKLMENSHAWLGASTSSIADVSQTIRQDSYQYQLQSMWQKCWNTNQNLMHHLRFRERGPLKSWRPETMAEAIFSVLKEGLSLSQAARKYDIPYPTFVLYANRVHNMLGPSIDGGTDLRPKGRGRPQRILLGIWPDEHIKGVIKTVVFRDAKELKDDSMHLSYGRHSPVFPFQEGAMNYPGAPCSNGLPNQPAASVAESMTPEATAAAVAAVAHGIRQQMQMAAAAQQHHTDAASNLFNLPAHLQHSGNAGVPLPKQNSPASGGQMNANQQRHTSPSIPGLPNPAALGLPGIPNMHMVPGLNSSTSQAAVASASSVSHSSNAGNQQTTVTPAHLSLNTSTTGSAPSSASRIESPSESAHDLRMNSPEESPLNSPLGIPLEPAVNLAVGVSGMAYKPSRGYSSPRPEHLFQEDIADLVGNTSRNCPPNMSTFKEPPSGIKIEPMAECRSENSLSACLDTAAPYVRQMPPPPAPRHQSPHHHHQHPHDSPHSAYIV